ncbi:sulfotransferase [Novosphingobium indicum]|uniref:Sulfotransferase n=1 Tax=Novosphingobium indicum TaxID=462949 RepID=A0ABQ2K1M2_9SPHN|nr:sulfotransferase [Novosphingobium indicum]GGN61360.1 sulfotransferase [Novosphingobium indicum]
MAERIDIADLTAPHLTDAQKQMIAAAEAVPFFLEENAVLDAARQATGLSDFGSDDFVDRMRRLIDEWNGDTRAYAVKRHFLMRYLVRYATNRLLIHDTLKKHPEIHDEQIDRPIIVVGMPRSGTTHLLNLLGADTRLRSTPLWETYEPVRNPLEPDAPGGVDPRYARCAAQWEASRTANPLAAAMHPMEPDHFHEDLELMCADFASYNFEWIARSPKWRDFYLSTDQTPHYEYMKTCLKLLQWQDVQKGLPRKRWVTKCPQHLEQLPVLKAVFPDATVAITYRDPVEVIQSAITMIAYGERNFYPHIDTQGLLDYWSDRVETLLRACVRDRDVWPESQRIDVPFEQFMADDIAVVRQVRAKAGLPETGQANREIADFIASHPRGKHGQIVYNLERDFGITPAQLRKRFDFYFEAYPFLRRPSR